MLSSSRNGNVSYAFTLALDPSSAPNVVGQTNGGLPDIPGAFQPSFNEPLRRSIAGGMVSSRFNTRQQEPQLWFAGR